MLQAKRLTNRSMKENTEPRTKLIHIWRADFWKPLWKTVWQHLKKWSISTLWSSHSAPRYSPPKKENMCLYNDLYMNVHCIFICNSPQTGTTQMSINRWTDHFATCVYQIILLYSLNLQSIICHLYLRKAGKKVEKTLMGNWKQFKVHPYNGILSNKKEWATDTRNNTDESK